jgi:hypothetical protein
MEVTLMVVAADVMDSGAISREEYQSLKAKALS